MKKKGVMKMIIAAVILICLVLILCDLQGFKLFWGLCGSKGYEKQSELIETVQTVFKKQSQTFTGLPSEEHWQGGDFSTEDMILLPKEAGEDFVVLNITDTHFADQDGRAWLAFEAELTIKRLVADVKPDLITVTGDLVCSDHTEYSIRRLTDLFESFGIPWAPVFGNHDDEGNCDLNYLADIMLKAPNCILRKGDSEMGVGNYIIGVMENDRLVEAFIMMDSHTTQPNEKQQQWYSWAAEGISRLSGGNAEVSLFMHIPLPEYQYAYDLAWDEETGTWKDEYSARGELHEPVCCEKEDGSPVQRGFFECIKQSGNTRYVFCGHEHLNNFSILYDGVRLTYTLKVGGGSGARFGFNGGTVITVGNDGIQKVTHKTYSYGIPWNIVNISEDHT